MGALARKRSCLVVLLLTCLLLPVSLAPQSAPLAAPAPFPTLSADGEPLRAAFNRDVGKVRLLLILDPT